MLASYCIICIASSYIKAYRVVPVPNVCMAHHSAAIAKCKIYAHRAPICFEAFEGLSPGMNIYEY